MLVILRLFMRELLGEVEGGGLCASIGPFDSKGKAFNAGRPDELLKFVGVHFLGIPRFSVTSSEPSTSPWSARSAWTETSASTLPRYRWCLAKIVMA